MATLPLQSRVIELLGLPPAIRCHGRDQPPNHITGAPSGFGGIEIPGSVSVHQSAYGVLLNGENRNTIQHVIWSSLEDTRKWVPLSDNRMPTLMGKYKVPHFDAKGEADQVFSGLGLP